ncbi:MAG: glycine--tRNA ligase subunit beta [Syntrophus sp. (in: bacteria)]|nr:glycine--tRNA ligase subunit beta [Syntrophus sp. (in: bacteria)]
MILYQNGASQLKTLLLEIGTEEIPARFLEPAKEGLYKLLKDGLAGLQIASNKMEVYATPRRIAVIIQDVVETQEERVSVKYGPPYNRAFDPQGKPTPAATGFAKSQGVSLEDLKKGTKDGVDFVVVEKNEGGRQTMDVLPDLLRDAIARIPFQKRMRWGRESFEFARPIQWVVALFGNDIIGFSVADVQSGNITYGHRFLSKGMIVINDPSDYIETLRANYIIVKEEERMAIILEGIRKIEEETGGTAIRDADLIKEICYITEYPYPLRGAFDEAFLEIPKEVLVNVMKSHQRYIPIEKKINPPAPPFEKGGQETQHANGGLMPYFIFFANTIPLEDKNVIKGNEKVLRARLADARFFFDEDRKNTLYDLYDRLSSIVWHVKLGTLKEKTDRIEKSALYLATILNYHQEERIKRAVRLIKSDLLTHMVGEFAELQGVMGRIYAEAQGEDRETARAIEEHYLPTGGSGALPETTLGAILGIADKCDSLVSFFSVGITPTGTLDPFALRRQTLGIIRIIIDKTLHIPLERLVEKAYESGSGIKKRITLEETKTSLNDFIIARFKFSMIEESHNQEFVESVLPFVPQDIYDAFLRLRALETQNALQDFQRLMVGFKRVYNITKSLAEDLDVDRTLFKEAEEEALFDLYESTKTALFLSVEEKRYADSLTLLVGFKETIDNFFEKVFVMDKDEAIKNNRLALLKKIKDMFLTYGDFSKIRIE